MIPLYGPECLPCLCLQCLRAGRSGQGGSCPCCRECYQLNEPLHCKTCSDFTEWPAE